VEYYVRQIWDEQFHGEVEVDEALFGRPQRNEGVDLWDRRKKHKQTEGLPGGDMRC